MKNIKVLYKKHYFERDLFLLEIDGKYTKVYRSSGLNGGRKGRILPFMDLQDTLPRFSEAMMGIGVGWISKYFFFKGEFINHYKYPGYFGDEIEEFLLVIENELKDIECEIINYNESDLENENLMIIAGDINNDMKDIIKEMECFDWGCLITKPIDKEIEDFINSLEATLSRRARSMFAVDTTVDQLELTDNEKEKYLPILLKKFFVNKNGVIMRRKELFGDTSIPSEYIVN